MTGDEMLDALAHSDWEKQWEAVLQEAKPRFKAIRTEIDMYYKDLELQEKARKREEIQKQKENEREMKKQALDAEWARKLAEWEERQRAKSEEKAQKAAQREEKRHKRNAEMAQKVANQATTSKHTRRGALVNSDEAEYHDTAQGTPRRMRQVQHSVHPRPVRVTRSTTSRLNTDNDDLVFN